jgi:hypothetical protein
MPASVGEKTGVRQGMGQRRTFVSDPINVKPAGTGNAPLQMFFIGVAAKRWQM